MALGAIQGNEKGWTFRGRYMSWVTVQWQSETSLKMHPLYYECKTLLWSHFLEAHSQKSCYLSSHFVPVFGFTQTSNSHKARAQPDQHKPVVSGDQVLQQETDDTNANIAKWKNGHVRPPLFSPGKSHWMMSLKRMIIKGLPACGECVHSKN